MLVLRPTSGEGIMVLMRQFVFPCFIMAGVSFTHSAAAQEREVYVYDFHIHEQGNFFGKTISQLGTNEFAAIVTAACAAFAVDCSGVAAGVAKGAHALSEEYISQGENYYITGTVDKHDGEEWGGKFTSMGGYEICNARLDYGDMGISGNSTFNVAIFRNGGGNSYLAYYAVVPKNRGRGEGVDAHLAIEWVPVGTADALGCPANQSNPWLCKGQNCSPLSRF